MAGIFGLHSTSPKKPSPLSFGAQRSSPFKRPEPPFTTSQPDLRPSSPQTRSSSTSPIPTISLPNSEHQETVTSSPIATNTQGKWEPRTDHAGTRAEAPTERTMQNHITTTTTAPAAAAARSSPSSIMNTPTQPQSVTSQPAARPARPAMQRTNTGGDPISKLHPAQLRDMRESFQVMDRDNDGQVDREDIAEVLTQLGLDASAPSLTPYFPPSAPPKLNLSTYLNMLSSMLADLSRHDELAAAFAAFDVDDSGQIDIDELRDALVHVNAGPGKRALTARDLDGLFEEFGSRRTLAKGMAGKEAGRRGDVFRYMDFMAQIQGSNKNGQGEQGVVDGVKA